MERAKQELAKVKSDYQDLKKSHKKLESQAKKNEKAKKVSKHTSSASIGESDDSSFENLYYQELQRNLVSINFMNMRYQ